MTNTLMTAAVIDMIAEKFGCTSDQVQDAIDYLGQNPTLREIEETLSDANL